MLLNNFSENKWSFFNTFTWYQPMFIQIKERQGVGACLAGTIATDVTRHVTVCSLSNHCRRRCSRPSPAPSPHDADQWCLEVRFTIALSLGAASGLHAHWHVVCSAIHWWCSGSKGMDDESEPADSCYTHCRFWGGPGGCTARLSKTLAPSEAPLNVTFKIIMSEYYLEKDDTQTYIGTSMFFAAKKYLTLFHNSYNRPGINKPTGWN